MVLAQLDWYILINKFGPLTHTLVAQRLKRLPAVQETWV